MEIVYVGLDLGSSSFQQVAIKADGSIKVNRSFTTSEANLRAAFADQRGEIHVHLEAGELAPWAASVIGRYPAHYIPRAPAGLGNSTSRRSRRHISSPQRKLW